MATPSKQISIEIHGQVCHLRSASGNRPDDDAVYRAIVSLSPRQRQLA